jgi:hypothetical protein
MRKRWLAWIAVVLAMVLVGGTFDTAQAGKRGGFHGRGGAGHFGGRHFGGSRFVGRPDFYRGGHRHYGHRHPHRHYGRHFRRGIIIGAPFVYGGYYSGYGSCRWLRIRALETGSRYWWARYEDCLNGY